MGFKGHNLQVNTLSTRKVLSRTDEAINPESDIDGYAANGYDTDKLRILEGEDVPAPCWFTIRPIAQDDFGMLCHECDSDLVRVLEELFRVCVTRVDNLRVMVNGAERPYSIKREKVAGRLDRMTDESFGVFPRAVRAEIASVAYNDCGFKTGGDHEKNC